MLEKVPPSTLSKEGRRVSTHSLNPADLKACRLDLRKKELVLKEQTLGTEKWDSTFALEKQKVGLALEEGSVTGEDGHGGGSGTTDSSRRDALQIPDLRIIPRHQTVPRHFPDQCPCAPVGAVVRLCVASSAAPEGTYAAPLHAPPLRTDLNFMTILPSHTYGAILS
ncbi:hypothetical protein NDU88_000254 [Pleurodeles waltl]|uniref:Uncharacterized protein n=1 Tax=Pleurodeles waltl TaxID=8319 RepID=A0AAV7L699_PLEWA|nr:hypothetical protein NDU88_000254 [Pleurodeles waltl]